MVEKQGTAGLVEGGYRHGGGHPSAHVLECRRRARRPGHLPPEILRPVADPHLAPAGGDRARDRHGPDRAGLRARRDDFDPRQHPPGVAVLRSRRALRRRRQLRHLSDRRAGPGRIPDAGLALGLSLRRGRGAARQGAGGPRAPAAAAPHRRLGHDRPARPRRPPHHQPRAPARDRPRAHRTARQRRRGSRVAGAHRQPQAAGSGDPHLHLRHHRQAEGGDALAPQCFVFGARLQPDHRPGRNRRAHVLPAAVPCRRAHGRRLFLPVHRHRPELRREPRDDSRERPRDPADGVPRRAAHLGEVLFRRDDRPGGSHQPREARLQMGHRCRHEDGRTLRSRPADRRRAARAALAGAGPGAQQRAPA